MAAAADPNDLFRQEARELLEVLEQTLLDLEQNPSQRELIDSAFRALHTIKGSGAMFGFDEVAKFVHGFETAFDRVRKGSAPPGNDLIKVALRARDHIHMLIEDPANASGGDIIVADLEAVVQGRAATVAGSDQPSLNTYLVRFRLPEDALLSGANPLLMLDELRGLGAADVRADTSTVPALDDLNPEVCYIVWEVELTTSHDRRAIEDVFMFMIDDMQISIDLKAPADVPSPIADEPAAASAAAATPRPEAIETPQRQSTPEKPKATPTAEKSPEKGASSLRVAAERLDELMDRVGELVIAQARLSQLASSSSDPSLKLVAEELERLSSGLRDTTMGIRMVPIGTLFGRFRRLVHDLSHDLGKDVSFVTAGEETELDKTVVEKLADPLVHLIRNAVDHGLETGASRTANGKPAAGTVRLSAVHAGAEVAISITDDGAGLNAARIRAKAEEQGLITPETKLADQELYQLIFHPGFSTAREITSVSGRGVGMDVVKRTIESLRGSIDVSTTLGRGTTVTLRLPLTLAIIDGMLVRVGKGRYTIPLSAVEECVELPIDIDQRATGRNFLNIRGTLVPFLRLRELFNAKTAPDQFQKVVIVSQGDFRVGLVVDQIIGNNQTVIKSLSKLHADVEGFSGATILGDGTVALILDVPHLVGYGQAFEDRLRNGRAA